MLGVWYKVASSEPSNYTFSVPTDLASGAILRYSGADPANPINASGAAFGNSKTPTAPNVTTTAVHTTVLRIAGVDNNHFAELDDDDTPYPAGLTGLLLMNTEVGTGPDPSLAAADTPQPPVGPTGTAVFDLQATEEWRAVTIVIQPVPEELDATPPVVTITSPANGNSFELDEVVLADYVCTDTGSGINTCAGDVADGTAIDTSTLGAHTFTATGTDNQGNSTVLTHSYTVVDTTAPDVTITTPADGASFELHEVVPADYACTDAGSGIDTCAGDVANGAAIDTSTLGAHTFTVIGTDNVGNVATLTHSYTVVDTTAPIVAITTPADGAILEKGVPTLAAYTCTDGGSGVASCAGDVANGAAFDTATEGAKTFTVTGTDNEGNVTVVVNSYTVMDTIAENAPVFESAATSTANAASITIGKPAGTAIEDLLIATVIHGGDFFPGPHTTEPPVTITPPSGWTQIDHDPCPSNTCTLGVWYKVVSGSEPSSYTFAFSGDIELSAGAILRYSGADPNDPINASGAATGTTSSPTSPDVTTTVVDTRVVRIAGVDNDKWAAAPYPAGHFGRFAIEAVGVGPDPTLAAADKAQAPIGPTGSAAFSHVHDGPASTHPWRAVTVVIKPLDNAPTLKLVKAVINDDQGSSAPNDWTLTATRSSGSGDASRDFSTPGGSGDFETVFANAGYSLAESAVADYTASSWSCTGGTLLGSTIILGPGDAVTCTITNDDDAPLSPESGSDEPGVSGGSVNAAPTATIASPEFYATFLTTDSITFSGSGDDSDGGNLIGLSLVWTSDIDGQIGTGTSFTRSLSAGEHTITLTATDGTGLTGDAIRIIYVVPPATVTPEPTATPTPVVTDPGGGGGGGGGGSGGPGGTEATSTPTPTPVVTDPGGSGGGGGGGGGGSGPGGPGGTEATPTPTPTPVVAEPGGSGGGGGGGGGSAPTPTPVVTEPTATPVPGPTATPVPAPSPAPGATPEPPSPPIGGTGGGGGSALPAGGLAGIILAVIAVMAAAIYYDVKRRRGRFI